MQTTLTLALLLLGSGLATCLVVFPLEPAVVRVGASRRPGGTPRR